MGSAASSSSSSSSAGHDHRRTRSVGAARPSSSRARARAHHHAPRHSESSVPRRAPPLPPLPPLDLPEEGLGTPDVEAAPTRHTLPRRGSGSGFESPLDLPQRSLDFPGVHPAPARRDGSSASATGNGAPNWEVPLFEDQQRRETPPEEGNQEGSRREPPPGVVGKILVFLGYVGPNAQARRALVSLVFSQLWGLSQFVVVIALLAVSARTRSPTNHELTEWSACDRPLGPWNALWLVKVLMNAWLSYWDWHRGHAHRIRQQRRENSDTELATQRVLNGQPHYPQGNGESTTAPRRQQSSQGPPRSPVYARLSFFTSFFTLAWFLAAHVFEYTSVNSCRLSSPHLWWLTFAILCTLYLMLLEIFLLGLLVFVLGPVLYIAYNIILLCLGRHPLQNPHYIKPDIGKLPKSVVDQIPLVLYIPPPPGEPTDTTPPITVPAPAHAYPPKSPTPSSTVAPKRRFTFFLRKDAKKKTLRSSQQSKGDSGSNRDKEKEKEEKDIDIEAAAEEEDEDVPWDEMWEKSEYPFVRLEGNRAVCAICLMDFEEPKRVRRAKGSGAGVKPDANANANANTESGLPPPPHGQGAEGEGKSAGEQATQEIQVEAVTEEERDALQGSHGEGEGEGPEPLRLLACGHVFHKKCLDPWLTDISGRCPICQRPVEVPQPTKKSKRGRRRRT